MDSSIARSTPAEQVKDDFSVFLRSEKRLSPHTVTSYSFDLQAWIAKGLDVVASHPPTSQWIAETLKEFLDSEKLLPSSIARRQASLRSFVRYKSLSQADWERVLKYLPSGKAQDSWPEARPLEEIEQFLDFEPQTFEKEKLRNKALLELMYASGLRVSEAISIEWSQIDERAMIARIFGKGQKERLVPFTERAWLWLELYRKTVWGSWSEGAKRADSKKVFLSHLKKPLSRMGVWKILQKRSLEAGIDHLHPHVLRHSFATHLIEGGADVRFVQAMLGHGSINTTERYLKVADKELVTMVEKYHPLFQKKHP